MARDTVKGTLVVAATLCVVCSVAVSLAAVVLRPIQAKNKALDIKKNILIAAGLGTPKTTAAEVDEAFKSIESDLIDLATGEVVGPEVVDPETFDPQKAAKDPELGIQIERKDDLAGLGKREKYTRVYRVMQGGRVAQIILPIRGKGLWSTLKGFIALDADGRTVRGLSYYEHKETPGLGGEVDNQLWKDLWPGKRVFDDQGEVCLQVIKGRVDPNSPQADHTVDGLAGATITTKGVDNMMRYWFGENGYGPYLARLKSGGS